MIDGGSNPRAEHAVEPACGAAPGPITITMGFGNRDRDAYRRIRPMKEQANG